MKKANVKKLKSILIRLTRKYSPGQIQSILAAVYGEYSRATHGAENDFWFKCSRASENLASGMTKWAQNMLDELETGEEDDTEGG